MHSSPRLRVGWQLATRAVVGRLQVCIHGLFREAPKELCLELPRTFAQLLPFIGCAGKEDLMALGVSDLELPSQVVVGLVGVVVWRCMHALHGTRNAPVPRVVPVDAPS